MAQEIGSASLEDRPWRWNGAERMGTICQFRSDPVNCLATQGCLVARLSVSIRSACRSPRVSPSPKAVTSL